METTNLVIFKRETTTTFNKKNNFIEPKRINKNNTLEKNTATHSANQFNKCIIKFNARKSGAKTKIKKYNDFYGSRTNKYGDDSIEREKRLLDCMDRSKIYMNSLKEHLRTSRQNKVLFDL